MSSVNKVILIGNLGTDPEVKHLENDNSVANFPIATSETYKNKQGEKVTNTEWHRIVMWGNLAKIAEKYLKKGAKIYVEGKLVTEKYTDKDGNDRYTTKIVCNNLTMLSSNSAENTPVSNGVNNDVNNTVNNTSDVHEDDLPF